MKNKKIQRKKIFGTNPMPNAGSDLRKVHMSQIGSFIERFIGIEHEITPGKINASGKLIKKPNWGYGKLTYEPNPDAMVHEIGHLFLAPMGISLADYDNEMRAQFGHVIKTYGYLKQKRSLFEVMPMAMEQKIRRMAGLPPSQKHIVCNSVNDGPRTCLETGEIITNRVKKGKKVIDYIRCSRLLDYNALKRLRMIQEGILKFDVKRGWYYNNNIDAKINLRAMEVKS
jgi:hypothetical protein